MQVGESTMMSQAYHQPSTLEEVRTLWIGDLQYWVDESYLHSCFAHTGEVISIKIIRNKLTGQPEGYGFVEFVSHGAAERILQAYNGAQMPGTEQMFRLNWASFGIGEKRPDAGPEHSIFVGDLSPDVTDYLLQETFRVQYPSVRAAKVVTDTGTGRSKGYGFVKFADEMERNRAMAEMNGVYCSTRPMRISAATPKKTTPIVLLGLQQPALPKGSNPTTLTKQPSPAPATPPAQPVPADADTSNATVPDPEEELKQKQAARLSWSGAKDGGAGWAEQQPDGAAAAAAAAVAGQWSAYYAAAAAAYGGQQTTGDCSSYAAAYDSYAYSPYAGYVQQQYQNSHQADALLDPSAAVVTDHPREAEPYDPLATPDVDKLNAIYIGIHGGAILGRPMWQRTSPSLTQHN